jgi:hypothetical protein
MGLSDNVYCVYCRRYPRMIRRNFSRRKCYCRIPGENRFYWERAVVTGESHLRVNEYSEELPGKVKARGACKPSLTLYGKLRKMLGKEVGPDSKPAPNE